MLESGSRVDKALKVAIAEMYLQGVSTRRVSEVMEQLCGLEVSLTQVSHLTAELDETFAQWRQTSFTPNRSPHRRRHLYQGPHR